MSHVSAKLRALEKIRKEITSCRVCRKDGIGKPVPGEGNPSAKFIFVGEAPGKKESATGLPFIGRSGIFLRKAIQDLGLDDEKDVFILSPVKYLPKTGTPTREQVIHGRIHFQKQVDIINPKIVVLMGRVAAFGALGDEVAVSKLHGQTLNKNNRIYFFSYHPAAAMRFPEIRKSFKSDFKKLKKLLN